MSHPFPLEGDRQTYTNFLRDFAVGNNQYQPLLVRSLLACRDGFIRYDTVPISYLACLYMYTYCTAYMHNTLCTLSAAVT